jgi:hypothetical protein
MASQTPTSTPEINISEFLMFLSRDKRKSSRQINLYSLACKARENLAMEFSRPGYKLHLLVGHANLLDTVIFDLAKNYYIE